MEEVLIKPRKTRSPRRPVTWPPFYRTPNKDVSITQLDGILKAGNKMASIKTCPYMKYVPLHYLYSYASEYNEYYDDAFVKSLLVSTNRPANLLNTTIHIPDLSLFPECIVKMIIDRFEYIGNYRLDTRNRIEATRSIRNKFFMDTTPMGAASNRWTRGGEGILTALSSNEQFRFSARGYSGYAGMFSVQIGEMPLITATILGRDYIYHRANVLLGLPLDLSKVIIFVDRRLDNKEEDDIPKAFKTLYRTKLERILTSTAARIFKVPLEYIQDNCFMPTQLKIKAKKMREREQEIEEFLTRFYHSAPERILDNPYPQGLSGQVGLSGLQGIPASTNLGNVVSFASSNIVLTSGSQVINPQSYTINPVADSTRFTLDANGSPIITPPALIDYQEADEDEDDEELEWTDEHQERLEREVEVREEQETVQREQHPSEQVAF